MRVLLMFCCLFIYRDSSFFIRAAWTTFHLAARRLVTMRQLLVEQGRGQAGMGGVEFTVTWPTPASLTRRFWKKGGTRLSQINLNVYICCVLIFEYDSVVHLVFRYPVVLEQFSLRPGSGGPGKYCGGDGVVRKLLFRSKVVLSVLTERRSTRPYGLEGKLWFSCATCRGHSGCMVNHFVNSLQPLHAV